VVSNIVNTEFTYKIALKVETCANATLNAALLNIREMQSFARNPTVVEQSFADDVRDSQYEKC
jgi:hypothetical protein